MLSTKPDIPMGKFFALAFFYSQECFGDGMQSSPYTAREMGRSRPL